MRARNSPPPKKRARGGGRRGPETRCSEDLARRIGGHIEEGGSIRAAAAAEGVPERTLTEWRTQARAGREPYAGFVAVLERSVERAVLTAEKRVFAGEENWTGSVRWLESVRPEDWRRTEKRVHEGPALALLFPDAARPGREGTRAAKRAMAEALKE